MTTQGSVAGLFAGIGGLELGLQASGFHAELLCEIDANAQTVLRSRFPGVPIASDVTRLKSLPKVDILAAGFPCQDLSQAGEKAGIRGRRSGLVQHVLRLVGRARPKPPWIIIENVSYMLRLDQGRAMRFITQAFEDLGYRWAYRVVDARSFGVPQRRLRVVLLCSRKEDPRDVLFVDNFVDPSIISHRLQAPLAIDSRGPNEVDFARNRAYGFYWTEGRIGIGWTTDAVPTIKGGSSLAIPSPPAVWIPSTNALGLPHVVDGERLQGFPPGWTEPLEDHPRSSGIRWKLIGNAVCTHVSEWLGARILHPGKYASEEDGEEDYVSGSWPNAAYGVSGKVRKVHLSVWPRKAHGPVLKKFLSEPLVPLSERAATGFLSRAQRTAKIRYAPEFLSAVEDHIHRT